MDEPVVHDNLPNVETAEGKVEAIFVSSGGNEIVSDFVEVSQDSKLAWRWGNVSSHGQELPRRRLVEEPSGRVLYSVTTIHDDEDRHNRVHTEKPTGVPSRPTKGKVETGSHDVEIGSSEAGSIRYNATAVSPSKS